MKTKFLFLLLLLICFGCTEVIIPSTRENNMLFGNPSNATTSTANYDNFLIEKIQYTLSYNRSKATANWVSWHLNDAWKGAAIRQDDFRQDNTLPSGWYKVRSSDYTNSGFDRGHLCPSDDRDASQEDNSATFLMTNIVPQAPNHNRNVWADLEAYCRKLVNEGNELYIIAGVWGVGGTGSNGTKTKIANGEISVPASLWKVILILPEGTNDMMRIDANTRVIAVNIPNKQTADSKKWWEYRISVDELEIMTGYNFFNVLSATLQNQLESSPDTMPIL